MPATDITCDRCDYSGSTGIAFGIFKYQTPLGVIDLPRALGWCNTCESVAPIEMTDRGVKYRSLEASVQALESELADEIQRARTLLSRLFFNHKPENDKIRALRSTLASYRRELLSPSLLEDYFNSTRAPKCLSCGSVDVFEFPDIPDDLDDIYSNERNPKPIGIKHPGCGGEMYAATSEIRLFRRFSERLYSLNGDRIDGAERSE
ncbi:hypothetical protein [Marinobacter sp. S6332]|uniref:hypothetical protein n=1 Tax=Marinobacter sp. S6332 TaxID=2926403 RepID=UPI001FF2A24E|nr:hypothetical protein [Marinobacter sp. S6332]MCK0165914.1 hypothetical protein [Marinobacter sp. S6332]